MAHLQHNIVATGLIDFTFSPLVALWFACAVENINGKVIVLEDDSGKIEDIQTVKTLRRNLEEFFDVDQEQWYRWAPTLDSRTVDTERMTMQQSVFLFGFPEMNEEMITQEIIIPAEYKAKFEDRVGKNGNLRKNTVFRSTWLFREEHF